MSELTDAARYKAERDAARAELAAVKAERDEMRHWRDFYRAEAERMNDDAQCYAGHECGHCSGCTGDVDA